VDISRREAAKIVALGISQVPEGRRILPRLSVADNLEMGAFLRRDRDGIREDLQTVFGFFPVLAERRRQQGGTLSGGEQQMLAIGRALMARPRLLLLDEPSLGLAPIVVEKIFQIIRQISEAGTTLFLVEQNANLALNVSARAYVMESGLVRLEGPAADVARDETVREAYLGES
jgi:branched-chain amino acid transport system ATP-binding protein